MDSYFIVFAALSFVFSLLGFVMNALVCYMFYETPASLDSSNVIILSIAIGDMICSFVSLVFLPLSNSFGKWMFGTSVCEFYAFVATVTGLGSLFHLTAGAWERYNFINQSFGSTRTMARGKAAFVSLAMWLLALAWGVTPLIGWSNYELEGIGTSCSVNWRSQDPRNFSFIICLIVLAFIIPVCMIVIFHYKAFRSILRVTQRARRSWGASCANTRKTLAVERRMAVIFAIMTGAFLLAWTPYAVVSLVAFFQPHLVDDLTASVPSYFAKFSACYNPIVYVLMYKKFRKMLLRLMPACLKQSHLVPVMSQPYTRREPRNCQEQLSSACEATRKSSSAREQLPGVRQPKETLPSARETTKQLSSDLEPSVQLSSASKATKELSNACEPTMQLSIARKPTKQLSIACETTKESSNACEPTKELSSAHQPTKELSSARESTKQLSIACGSTKQLSTARAPTKELSNARKPTKELSSAREPTKELPNARERTKQLSSAREPTKGPTPASEPSNCPVPASQPGNCPTPASEPCNCPVPASQASNFPVPASPPRN